ncbi:MAG TPA: sigma-70 factor domain-containing protein, partial [Thermodesulfobacteriota bacterium]|nr:sigma-70 factor domain-containing protein [Thermodesulfobacteriota bacterium]
MKKTMLKKRVFPHMSKQMNKIKSQSKRGRPKSKNKGTGEAFQDYQIGEIDAIIGEEDIFIPIDIEDKIIPEIAEPEFDLQLESQKGEMGEEKVSQWTPDEEFRLLQVYFREMGTEPLLTPKEEVEVSAKIKKCEA